MANQQGWIGVDLDGTLAEYDEWKGPEHIGNPIPRMLFRVKNWLNDGKDVRIFTARCYHNGTPQLMQDAILAHGAITRWCLEHVGKALPVTNVKDYSMIELWDDRAVQVIPNTGERADGERG